VQKSSVLRDEIGEHEALDVQSDLLTHQSVHVLTKATRHPDPHAEHNEQFGLVNEFFFTFGRAFHQARGVHDREIEQEALND